MQSLYQANKPNFPQNLRPYVTVVHTIKVQLPRIVSYDRDFAGGCVRATASSKNLNSMVLSRSVMKGTKRFLLKLWCFILRDPVFYNVYIYSRSKKGWFVKLIEVFMGLL